MRGILTISLFILFLGIALPAHAAGFRAVDEDGEEQNTFEYKDDIYVEGTCHGASDKTVRIYIVDDQSRWSNGDPLTDVTGGAEIVAVDSLGNVPFTRVWKGPLDNGEYDVVMDVNGNGVYDSGEGCIDIGSGEGFLVLKKPTQTIRANLDEHFKSPDDHVWTAGVDDRDHILLIFEVKNPDEKEAIRLTEIELEARGTGDDTNALDEVFIVLDKDTSETYNTGDKIAGKGKFSKNNGKVHIEIFERLERNSGDEKNELQFLVVYRLNESIKNADTFQVLIRDIEGYGVSTGDPLDTRPLPLESAEMIVYIPDGSGINTQDPDSDADNVSTKPSGGFLGFGGDSLETSDTGKEPISFDFGDGLSLRTRAIMLGTILLLILWRVGAGLWRWFQQ